MRRAARFPRASAATRSAAPAEAVGEWAAELVGAGFERDDGVTVEGLGVVEAEGLVELNEPFARETVDGAVRAPREIGRRLAEPYGSAIAGRRAGARRTVGITPLVHARVAAELAGQHGGYAAL